jgi:hypothetical protein
MQIKLNSINKIICLLLLALCCLFVTCKELFDTSNLPPNSGDPDDDYNNPNAGAVRELTFSHNSGLYVQQFSLTISASSGSSVYYSTDGSVPSPNKSGTVKYSSPITVQNRNGQANVLATAANSTQMYMVPNDPRGNAPSVYQPTNDQVPKATVIRAIAVDSKGVKSGVATKTYFIGNNLTSYANHRVVSLVSDPDNLVSQDRGIMVRGKSSYRWDSNPPYNFRMKGADWEREAYLEIFEGNGTNRSVLLSTGVGIRVRGGWSRGMGQKSFSVYFKEQYGINNLRNYNLIPGALGAPGAVKADKKTPVERYKGFMLRNGANDGEYTKFYDVFLQDLLSDRSFSTQASVPCVVYLNGEYWGPYNFQERYSDNHTEYKYGVKKENVISYDNGELDDGNPGEESYFWNMMNMANNNMSVSSNYDAFCAVFDIDNFIDYWAAEIYIYNEDWSHNNYRVWRTRDAEPGNPYGDKKWRWQMFDTEFALGIYNSGGLTGQSGKNAFDEILNGDDKNHHNNKLFKALLANPDFCKKFVNTMMDLYNVNFHPDVYGPKLNSYVAVYRPLMKDNPGYFSRWGGWGDNFDNKVNDARKYLNDIRNVMTNNYLPTYFGGYSGIANIGVSTGSLRDVTLSAAGVSGTSIKINSITPNFTGSWTGKYYSAIPVTVTADAPPSGYEFEGWIVTGGTADSPSSLTTVVNLTGNAQIIAKYKQIGSVVIPVTGISLNNSSLNLKIGDTSNLTATVTPSGATYKTVLWNSGNNSVATVDSTGKVTAVNSGTAVITASTVEGVYTATCTVTVKPPTVLLDLAAKLNSLSSRNINNVSDFNTAFGDLPLGSSHFSPDAKLSIISDKKLKIEFFSNGGGGLEIKAGNGNIVFKTGDKIEIKGTFTQIEPGLGFILNTLTTADPWWRELQSWGQWNNGNFEKTFTLTQNDASQINANGLVRIAISGIAPYDGTIYPAGTATMVLEQIKVYRIE